MFNNSIDFKHNVTFNSVSGTLVKSCEASKFTRFHQNSQLAKSFFDSSAPNKGDRGETPIQVLQVMLCGDKEFLVEYVENTGKG